MKNSPAKEVNPELIEALVKVVPLVTTEILMETALELAAIMQPSSGTYGEERRKNSSVLNCSYSCKER